MRDLSVRYLAVFVSLCCLSFASAVPLFAQVAQELPAEPAPIDADLQLLIERVTRLESSVGALQSRVDQNGSALSQFERDLQTLAQGILNNETSIRQNISDIANNRQIISDLQLLANDNDRKLRDIARFDSGSGRHVPILLGNMQQSPSFRDEVFASTRGRIVIENPNGREQYLHINGVRWRAIPGRSFAPVPRGPVTVRTAAFAPQQILNNWQLDDRGFYVYYNLPPDSGGPGAPPDLADPPPDGPTGVVVRRDWRCLSPEDKAAFIRGVAVMMLDPNDYWTSWEGQAEVHLQQCPHTSPFFLPWHRMYLLHFERILRRASGDLNLALPYWKWGHDHKLPEEFQAPTLTDSRLQVPSSILQGRRPFDWNPLYAQGVDQPDGERRIPAIRRMEANLPDTQNPDDTRYRRFIVDDTNTGLPFFYPVDSDFRNDVGFSASLENTPHNTIHNTVVDGTMGANWSPLDPIFWVHHCNIDRIWEEWRERYGGQNPTWETWWMTATGARRGPDLNAPWAEFRFYDENGRLVPEIGRDPYRVQEFLEPLQLGYQYDHNYANASYPNCATGGLGLTGQVQVQRAWSNAFPRANGLAFQQSEWRVAPLDFRGLRPLTTYGPATPQAFAPPTTTTTTRGDDIKTLGDQPVVTLTLPLPPGRSIAPTPATTVPRAEGQQMPQLDPDAEYFLVISGIEFDAAPSVTYQVFLNLPEQEFIGDPSPHYAGSLAFFGGHVHRGNLSRSIRLSRAIRSLMQRGLWREGQPVQLTIVKSAGLVGPDGRRLPTPPGETLRYREARIVAVRRNAGRVGSGYGPAERGSQRPLYP